MVGYCGMGTEFTIDASQRLVIVTFKGPIDMAERDRIESLILAHPDFDPSFSEIIDCSLVTASNVSTDTIRTASLSKGIFNPTAMRVVVAPRDYVFGLARMGQAFAEQTTPNVVVVRTMAEAVEVLSKIK